MKRLALTSSLLLVNCLGPMVPDDVAPGDAIGDPTVPLLHVEDDPANRAKLASFTSKVDYLKGFADGRPIWYWNANGPVPALIAPMYVVINTDATEEPPIIDALPGEPGYSPWWRKILVRATALRTNERFTSRAAIDQGVALGLLETPEVTTTVVDAVVVRRELPPVALGEGKLASPGKAYYRGRELAWLQWSHAIDRPTTQKELDVLPVYILQRIDEPLPIYEIVANQDLNGDRAINASNNVFAVGLAAPSYTPMWEPVTVRTVEDLRSIDTSTATPEVTAEADILDGTGGPKAPRILSLSPSGRLVNCPIQATRGEL